MKADSTLAGKRVALLVQNLPVPFDRRVWQEATTLHSAGAEVVVISPDDDRHEAGRFDIDGITVVRYKNPPEASGPAGYFREYVLSLWRMKRALSAARGSRAFDIVHFCNPPDLLYLVAKSEKRRSGAMAVFDQHDLGPELVAAKSMKFKRLFIRVAEIMERRTYRFADHVIATNESYKQIAMTRGRFASEDVTVVRSGPRRNWGDRPPASVDFHNGRQYLIGYLGVMGEQEGIEYLLRSVVELEEMGLDCQLSLIGSGPDRARLEALAISCGIADRVRFHGRVSDDELKQILGAADVCVNPDEVNPMNDLSTMNKIIEYMALGRPIVQFDVKEGRYSAQDASLYAAANDAQDFARKISDVLTTAGLAERMGAAGKERFLTFLSWEAQGARLVECYSRLLSKHG